MVFKKNILNNSVVRYTGTLTLATLTIIANTGATKPPTLENTTPPPTTSFTPTLTQHAQPHTRHPYTPKTPQEASKELDAKRTKELGLKPRITENPTPIIETPPQPTPGNITYSNTPTPEPAPNTQTPQKTSPTPTNTPQTPQPAATTPTPRQTPTNNNTAPINYQATGGTNTKAPTATSNNKTKTAIIETAKTGIGGTYIWGGKNYKAWDCSGYVSWVLAQHGIKTTAYTFAMKNELKPTSTPEPGDIIFQGGYNHVGIYLGDGMMVSALNPSEGTRIHPVSIMPIDGYYTAT